MRALTLMITLLVSFCAHALTPLEEAQMTTYMVGRVLAVNVQACLNAPPATQTAFAEAKAKYRSRHQEAMALGAEVVAKAFSSRGLDPEKEIVKFLDQPSSLNLPATCEQLIEFTRESANLSIAESLRVRFDGESSRIGQMYGMRCEAVSAALTSAAKWYLQALKDVRPEHVLGSDLVMPGTQLDRIASVAARCRVLQQRAPDYGTTLAGNFALMEDTAQSLHGATAAEFKSTQEKFLLRQTARDKASLFLNAAP